MQEAAEREKPSIYSFVDAGKEYLQKLTRWMMAALYLTPLQHLDQKHLPSIVEGNLSYYRSYSYDRHRKQPPSPLTKGDNCALILCSSLGNSTIAHKES